VLHRKVNIWENVKNKLTVDEVISSYIPIQSNGANYRCVCPFHKEKSPSLIISPQKGIWHCFGCGQGGDIFKFVEEYEHITKAEALQILAKKSGVELEKIERKPVSKEQVSQQELGFKYLDFGANTFHKVLIKLLEDRNNRVTQYCLSRGLTLETIKLFQIGYAPAGNFLLKLGEKHNLNQNILYEVGLLKKEEGKEIKDKFTDRLILPIWDKTGKVVGFTGRSIPPDKVERPKYLNSPQTEWFNKSQIWYGWHLARTHVLQEKKAIVVEGNMDVVASFQKNLQYTLASQGTSFTEAQIKMLSTITKNVWLAFDNDEAGKLSGDKFFKMACLYNLKVDKVLIPETFKDLDEYLKSAENVVLETENYLDYAIKQKQTQLSSQDSDIQKQAVLYVLDLISSLDEISREQYLLKLNKITNLSVNILSKQLKTAQKAENVVEFQEVNHIIENKDKSSLLVWQSLVASLINENYGKGLASLYLLLKHLFPRDLIQPSLEEYILQNKDELDLIKENVMSQQVSKNTFTESLTAFIDSKTVQLFQNQDLKEHYLNWKQRGVG
jgi:DNA primase